MEIHVHSNLQRYNLHFDNGDGMMSKRHFLAFISLLEIKLN